MADRQELREVLVIISKTGCGKSYLCQALGLRKITFAN